MEDYETQINLAISISDLERQEAEIVTNYDLTEKESKYLLNLIDTKRREFE